MKGGPTWDLSTEYSSLKCPEYEADFALLSVRVGEIDQGCRVSEGLRDPQAVARLLSRFVEARTLWLNLRCYAHCLASVDGENQEARSELDRAMGEYSRLQQAIQPVLEKIKLASPEWIERLVAEPSILGERAAIRFMREEADLLLPLDQESLLAAFALQGPTAWSKLYDTISGQLRIRRLDGSFVGAAQASNLMRDPQEGVRHEAHEGLQEAWEVHSETCSAALNAISGWRLEEDRRRGQKRKVHFLDAALHQARMKQETLDSMMRVVCSEGVELGRRSLKIRARILKKPQLDLWDLSAPPPVSDVTLGFDEAFDRVVSSLGNANPALGKFARMVAERRWIEASSSPRKRPGGYCTDFAKSRTPRIYMTFGGAHSNLVTLAHEIGHAYHDWVLRDLSLSESFFPMTLAETASLMTESLVRLDVEASTTSDQVAFAMGWSELDAMNGMFLHTPMRFEFEKRYYERRDRGTLSVAETRELASDVWRRFFGETTSGTDRWYWQRVLHFYIERVRFYNFPYTFGYLLSAGLLAQKEAWGDGFFERYVDFLRDTGRMTVEEIAQKHLDVDLTQEAFWRASIRVIRQRLETFERRFGEKTPTA